MRGYLSLDPDAASLARLLAIQNRLHDGLNRQGVHFPERLGLTLLTWPFATRDELDRAIGLIGEVGVGDLTLRQMEGRPNADRPAEIGFACDGCEELQRGLFEALRSTLDPDPIKPPFIRLVRVSPPSRKIGAALRSVGIIRSESGKFVPRALSLWRQSPDGFEIHRTLRI